MAKNVNAKIAENVPQTQTTAPALLSESEAATFLKTSVRTIRDWRRFRGLPHVRISNKVVLFRAADLDGWLASRVVSMGTK